MTKIGAAGNVIVPAYLALKQRGYTVTCSEGGSCWRAISHECEFIGEDPIVLLGLVALYETRGSAWKASDEEIEDFMKQFDLETPEV